MRYKVQIKSINVNYSIEMLMVLIPDAIFQMDLGGKKVTHS